jgi:uncharacterized repeat protein (TIGR01451 family)
MKTKLLLVLAFLGFGFAFGQNNNPAFTISDATANEGSPIVFTVTLANSCNLDTVLSCYTTTVTANPSDFTGVQLNVAIPAGQTSATVTVPTVQDLIAEPSETFSLVGAITAGCNANPNLTNTATGVINDNDPLPTFVISNQTVEEGGNAVFTISLSNPSYLPTVINVTTVSDTATNSDFVPVSTVVTIPAGSTSAIVPVFTLQGTTPEPNEIFTLCGTVTSTNTANTTSCGNCIIIDNSNAAITANNDTFTLPASGISTQLLNVTFNDTLNGLSVTPANSDVTPTSQGPLSIDANGMLTVAPNTPAGAYTIIYTLCVANTVPANCDTAIVTVIIQSTATITVSAVGTYNDYNNDGFTNVGDVINYQYTVTNTGQETLSNVQVFYNQSPVAGGPLATLAIGAVDTTTFTRTYVITQADINAGYIYAGAYVTALFNNQQVVNDFGSQTPLTISNGIKFNLFFDTNGNGVQNVGEQNYNGGNFTYQLNLGVIHTVNSNNGMFVLYENNATNSYNLGCSLSANLNNCNNGYTLATTSYSNITVANGSGITTYNFPITTAPCADLSVNLYQLGAPPRPGFTYINRIEYRNNGNQTITSGTVTFTRSTTVSAVSTLPATTATATGFTYNFTNLLPGEVRYIDVTMQVPTIPTVSLGQLVTNSVTASIPPNDAYPANNSAILTQVIVGSYDPNDKTESHGGKILFSSFSNNDYLTYKIQFENTGTAEAVNIRVNDVLDAKLNPNTIRMIAASHPYVLDRIGNTLNWKFNGVNLPPSVANTTTGKGYVVFQIKPTAGYAVGTIIPNIANIFFDFNPAIVTAPCTTQFVSTLAINDFDANELSVYPNPVQNNLTITNTTAIDSVSVFSVLGQEVINEKVNDLQTEINTSELTNGVYFVKVTSEGKEKTVKVVKE